MSEKCASSYSQLLNRFGNLALNHSSSAISQAFSNVLGNMANQAQIQNRRTKGISSLPCEYTKEDIGVFLRNPYSSEKELRQTSGTLKWTAYPYYKIIKTYQDIASCKYYFKPLYISEKTEKNFMSEAILVDKFNKTLRPDVCVHKIIGQALSEGKVFYVPRYEVDKTLGTVNFAFMQQLPSDWCTIVGFNNLSTYTVSFDMMYFLQPGSDYRQYGDLFEPFMEDFCFMFEKSNKNNSLSNPCITVNSNGEKKNFYPQNARKNAKVFSQNGRWFYYVTLPADKVWTFEIDDTSTAVASSLSGLMLTYSQQSDYEQAQLSLILNPLIKIFTGEIPYANSGGSKIEDDYRLSLGGRLLFETLFNQLMASSNTGGTAFFSAPVENIKSHDFPESANANQISESFLRYGAQKAGLAGVIPTNSDVKAGQAEMSAKLESEYIKCIYRQFEKMMSRIYDSFKLSNRFDFCMFGSIYTDGETRKQAESALSRGNTSAYYILSALDGNSWIDEISMADALKKAKYTTRLEIPPSAYTQSTSVPGRPQSEELSESKEKATDTYGKKL